MAIEHLFAFVLALMTFRDALVTLHRTDPALHAWMTEGVPVV